MNRSEARKVIMTILYQVFMFDNNKINYNLADVFNENLEIDNEFVKTIVKGVLDKKDELTKIANDNLNDWKLNRLGLPDQAIILMGLYELLYTDTPNKVCIDEAIELAKCFSDEKVVGMINGALDRVLHNEVK